MRLFLIILFLTQVLHSQTITVSRKGTLNSIEKAVRIAPPGTVIYIEAGGYTENTIIVTKPLSLIAKGKVIVAPTGNGDILLVKASGVEIRGITFRNVQRSFVTDNAAVKVDSTSKVTITGNTFINTFFGVYLSKSFDCTVEGNLMNGESKKEANSGNGIHLWNCRDITVKNNTVYGHRDGIYLEFTKNSSITGNNSSHHLRYGLHFMFSDNCVYQRNTFSNNGAGVAVMYSRNIDMSQNTFSYNRGSASYGLLLKDIKDSKVIHNTFLENSVGIFMEGVTRVNLEKNTIRNNGWAVKLMANSDENHFRTNNFLGNTFDISTNSRQNSNFFSKNYWDNYSGYDLNHDGFGDVPHHPVSLYSQIVVENPALLVLLKSFIVTLLDTAERIAPALTPATLFDPQPRMRMIR